MTVLVTGQFVTVLVTGQSVTVLVTSQFLTILVTGQSICDSSGHGSSRLIAGHRAVGKVDGMAKPTLARLMEWLGQAPGLPP